MLESEEEEGLRLWHLVKSSEDLEIPKHRKSSIKERERAKAIPEIYLTRLLSMKVMVYVNVLSRQLSFSQFNLRLGTHIQAIRLFLCRSCLFPTMDVKRLTNLCPLRLSHKIILICEFCCRYSMGQNQSGWKILNKQSVQYLRTQISMCQGEAKFSWASWLRKLWYDRM